MASQGWLLITMAVGLLALAAAGAVYYWVVRQDAGGERTRHIADLIAKGSAAYLRKLYASLVFGAFVLGIVITFVFSLDMPALAEGRIHIVLLRGLEKSFTFLIGAFASAAAGYLGMGIAVRANVRCAVAAGENLERAFKIAFRAGSVLGLAVVGTATIGIVVLYLVTDDPGAILSFSFGASSIALLAKAGGGIYTKTADIAADLVGKAETGMPEDDPRNPAVIADKIGDNVGDVAGMGTDIFDSYVASAVAAMILGYSMSGKFGDRYIVLPLVLCMLGIAASLIGILFVRLGKEDSPKKALNSGTAATCAAFTVLTAVFMLAGGYDPGILLITLSGLFFGLMISLSTNYFYDLKYRPVQETAKFSGSGPALNLVAGISYGFLSLIPGILGIVAATTVSYFSAEALGLPGIYGIGLAAVGMLSVTGLLVSADAYSPIADNSRGIAEMSGLSFEVIRRCASLDAAGNASKAITKNFTIGAAALTVLALFSVYAEIIERQGIGFFIDLRDPKVLAGAFIGALTPPVFSALTMLAVTRNAFILIDEVRRQLRDFPGIIAGIQKPDYRRCIVIAAQGSLKALFLPALTAIVLPLLLGFILGPHALGGFLCGAILTGVVFALFLANSGSTWENAKKLIETGGLGSEAYKSAVTGDMVGDPFKDTAGPSLNTLITVLTLGASLFAPFIAVFALIK